MYLQQLIQESQASIATWEVQIAELQAKILEMQEQIQMYGSVQSAMESADSLLVNAIGLIKRVCPEELVKYRDLIVSRFDSPAAGELPPTPVDSPEPPAPPAPTSDSPELENQPAPDTTSDTPVEKPAIQVQAEVVAEAEKPKPATSKDFEQFDWHAIRRIAKRQGIPTHGKARHAVEATLLAKNLSLTQLKADAA